MDLSCSIATTDAELDAITAPWAALAELSEDAGPMVTPLWQRAWWRVFGGVGRRRLRIAVFREGPVIVGVVPLVRRSHWYGAALPFRRLEWMGTGEDERDEIGSEYMAPITERGAERDVVRSLARELVTGTFGEWDELVLPRMDGGSLWPTLLDAELGALGLRSELRSAGVAARIDLPKTFDHYVESLPSSSRYLVRRSMRDFEAWAGGELELKAATSPAELELGQSVLMSLEDERSQGEGAVRSPRFHAFHEQVMPALLASGSLQLLWLSARSEPTAAIYNVIHRGSVYFYQAGRRQDLPKGLRPGIVMHAHAIRRSIEAGLLRYDFLGASARGAGQLAGSSRPLVVLRAVRPSVRESAREFASQAGEGARRFLERANLLPVSSGEQGSATAVLWGDLNMLRCFARTGIPTLAVSADPESATFFSRHAGARRIASDPAIDPEAAARDIVAIGRIFADRPVLFYGDDAQLTLISRERRELSRHFRFLMPAHEIVEKLVDKSRFATFAEDLGLPVPKTLPGTPETTPEEIARRIGFPCILKPAARLHGTNSEQILEQDGRADSVLRAEREADLPTLLERMRHWSPSFVVQKWIDGGEEQIRSFHVYVRADGTPLGHYVGRRIRSYPRRAGANTAIELIRDPELVRLGLDLTKRLGLVGVAKLDFKLDPRTLTYHLLDVSPRFNRWNHLGAVSGVNLPFIAYRDLTGAPAEPRAEATTGPRWLSFGDDARTFLRDHVPEGDLTALDWLRSYRGRRVYDVFAWDDPSPFVMHCLRAVRQRARGARA